MAIEIERKFLVHTERLPSMADGEHIIQGYIPTTNRASVRIRLSSRQSCITIKGQTIGISRSEFEVPVDKETARQLLKEMCPAPHVEKYRHRLMHAGLCWEVDVFAGLNTGLIVAELELQNEHQQFDKPQWAGAEVTFDERYRNSNLVNHPYSNWGAPANRFDPA